MKKRTIALVLVATLLFLCTLAGCSGPVSQKVDESALDMANFKVVEGIDHLVYSKDTKVVYYLFSTADGYEGYSYMAPYISENGNFCRYVNDEIVEITTDANN